MEQDPHKPKIELSGKLGLVAFLVVSIGVIILRRTAPDLPRRFKVPGYPVVPILAVLGCLWIILDLRPVTITAFAIWVGVVLVWYFTYGIRHSRLGDADVQNEVER